MDRLPQELVEEITKNLPTDDLKNVLTVSTKFRYAAERYSGAFTEFTLNERNADKFLGLYSGHRLLYLRELHFRPNFPPIWPPDPWPWEDEMCRENADAIRAKNECFTRQVHSLFTTLSTVEENAAPQHASGRYRIQIHDPSRLIHVEIYCPHQEYISWRIRLLNTELPLVHSVRSLEICNECPEDASVYHDSHGYPANYRKCFDGGLFKLDLGVMVDLVSKLPNLEYLGCKTGGFEWAPAFSGNDGSEDPNRHFQSDWDGPRRDARHNFAHAVISHQTQLPTSLQRASLDFVSPLIRALDTIQDRPLPNLVGPALRDPFSASLRILTNNLRQLRLWAIVDESLFSMDDNSQPQWPNLEILEVMFHPSRPDGSWYFVGPQGHGREAVGYDITAASYPPLETTELDIDMEELVTSGHLSNLPNGAQNQFRITPDEARLRPLLAGFSSAAAQMCSLRRAIIWTSLNWYPKYDYAESQGWDSEYQGPGSNWRSNWAIQYSDQDNGIWGSPSHYLPSQQRNDDPTIRCLVWMVAAWRPDAELRRLFQNIGREKHGNDLVEHWGEGYRSSNYSNLRNWMLDDHQGDPGRITPSLS